MGPRNQFRHGQLKMKRATLFQKAYRMVAFSKTKWSEIVGLGALQDVASDVDTVPLFEAENLLREYVFAVVEAGRFYSVPVATG